MKGLLQENFIPNDLEGISLDKIIGYTFLSKMFDQIPNLQRRYDSDENDIPNEFFIPVLSRCYRSVVAYFDSSFFFATKRRCY